jgi:hypothetical protein
MNSSKFKLGYFALLLAGITLGICYPVMSLLGDGLTSRTTFLIGLMCTSLVLGGALFLVSNIRLHLEGLRRQILAVQSALTLSTFEVRPLAFFGRHAAEPDFIEIIAEIIRRRGAKRVLELGSGTTSIHIKRLLFHSERGGVLVCLEESAQWADLVRSEMAMGEKCRKVKVSILHAPLGPTQTPESQFYSVDVIRKLEKSPPFDLFVIDGPGDTSLRENALEALRKIRAPNALFILDDGDHPQMRRVVQSWLSGDHAWKMKYYPTVRGTYVLWRHVSETSLPLP